MAFEGEGALAAATTSRIGPVSILVQDQPAAIERIRAMIGAPGPRIVAFCNAHTVNLARRDPAFALALSTMTVLNDGMGVDIGRHVLEGARFPANLNGTDFTPALLAAEDRPLRLFLLGSPPGVADRAGAVLSVQFPRHRIVGTRHGFFEVAEGDAVARQIAGAGADLVLVGMGQPRQEMWAAAHAATSGAVVLCIGAYLDFAAGVVPRAPAFVRRLRIEWLYRLAQEPRRLVHRYLVGNAVFVADVLRDRLRAENRSQ